MLSQIQKEAVKFLTPPKGDREMTQEQWCQTFGQGLSVATLHSWEYSKRAGDAEFQASLAKSRESYQHNPNYASEIARSVALAGLVAGAGMDGTDGPTLTHKRGCYKEIMKWTKDAVSTDSTVSYDDMPDEQLIDLILGKKLDADPEIAAAVAALKK